MAAIIIGLAVGALLRSPSPRCCTQSTSICSSAAWPALQAEMDELPCFVLANDKGEPLQHDRDGSPMTIFLADLFRAEAELANAKRMYPELNLGLLPVGLGSAFQRVQEGNAMLIPSQNEVAAAGLDPSAVDPSLVPLFGCTKIMKPRKSNPEVQAMPLFLSSEDARAALKEALSGFAVPDGMTMEAVGLDILCIPLQKACELITSGQETRFEFHAASKSVEWVEAYAKKNAEAVEKGEKANITASAVLEGEDASEKQAMFETLIDQRQQMLERTGGVIPDGMGGKPRAAPPKMMSFGDWGWCWGEPGGEAHMVSEGLRSFFATEAERRKFIQAVSVDAEYEATKVVLALKIERMTKMPWNAKDYSIDDGEKAAWETVLDDMIACKFEDDGGDDRLVAAIQKCMGERPCGSSPRESIAAALAALSFVEVGIA